MCENCEISCVCVRLHESSKSLALSTLLLSMSCLFPMATLKIDPSSLIWASTPNPTAVLTLTISTACSLASGRAPAARALPTGCSLVASTAWIMLHREEASKSPRKWWLTTRMRPEVMVPVLSNTTQSIPLAFSRMSAPLIKIPLVAPTPVPTITAVGAANPSAQGQATTTTEMATCKMREKMTRPVSLSTKNDGTLSAEWQ